jgi:hypothetical protein
MIAAYYTFDLNEVRARYQAAQGSLHSEEDPDLREAKRLRLQCSWVAVLDSLEQRKEAESAYRALVADCRIEQPGPASLQMARLVHLLVRLHADCHRTHNLAPGELAELIKVIPDEDRGPNFWQEIACWAFAHRDEALLEDAYAYFTTRPPAEMADFMYHRLRLMHLLMHGQATPQAVLETVSRIELAAQLGDFKRMLLPSLEEAGLLTPMVQAALQAKDLATAKDGKHAPPRTPTRGIFHFGAPRVGR